MTQTAVEVAVDAHTRGPAHSASCNAREITAHRHPRQPGRISGDGDERRAVQPGKGCRRASGDASGFLGVAIVAEIEADELP